MAWRVRSTGCHPVAPRRRGGGACPPPRTEPVAPTPSAQSQRSRSKPPGLKSPCGRFRRAPNVQRSPAVSAGGGPASGPGGRYQPSHSRPGTRTAAPSRVAVSTAKPKRSPFGPRWGSEAMRPTSTRSRPSRSGDSRSAWCASARQPVHPSARASPARAQARRRRSPSPNRPHAIRAALTAAGHRRVCCSCSAVPATVPASHQPVRQGDKAGAGGASGMGAHARQRAAPGHRLQGRLTPSPPARTPRPSWCCGAALASMAHTRASRARPLPDPSQKAPVAWPSTLP